MQQEKGTIALISRYSQDTSSFNRSDELLTPKSVDQVFIIAADTRSFVRRRRSPEVLQDEFFRKIRLERMKQAQEEEKWIYNLQEVSIGDAMKLSIEKAKLCDRIASEYEVDESGLLFYCSRSMEDSESLRRTGSSGDTRSTAAKISTSLPHQCRGRPPRDRPNVPTDPV